MHEQRLQYALGNYIKSNYFLDSEEMYILEEHDKGGESTLSVEVAGEDSLCISNFDKKNRCGFLKEESSYGMQMCADHILFQKKEGKWTLHIFEMKSSISFKKWNNIRLKTRSSYFNALAIASFLGIVVSDVNVVITYEKDDAIQSPKNTTNPALFKPLLGDRRQDDPRKEWNTGVISIEIGDPQRKIFPQIKVKMLRDPETSILQGMVSV